MKNTKTILSATIISFLVGFFGLACSTKPTITHKRGNDPQLVIDAYKANEGEIQPQIQRILSENGISQGEIAIEWTVNDEGRVTNAKIAEDTVGVPELNDLLLNHLNNIKFKKTPMFMTSSVVYKYQFNQKQ